MPTALKALLLLLALLLGGFSLLYCDLFGCRQILYFSAETPRMEQFLASLKEVGATEIMRSTPCRRDFKTGLYYCRYEVADADLELGEDLSEKKLISIKSSNSQDYGNKKLHPLIVMATCSVRSKEQAEKVVLFLEDAVGRDKSKSTLYKIRECGLSMFSREIWMTPDYSWRFDAENAVPVPVLQAHE